MAHPQPPPDLGCRSGWRRAVDAATYFTHDDVGNLTALTDGRGNETDYGYDAAGQMTWRRDGRGQVAYFEYDAAGRPIAAKYEGVEPAYFEYGAAGSRTVMLDEWGATYWTYDALSRPISRHDPRGAVVKLILPSGKWNSWGGAEDGYCVPTR